MQKQSKISISGFTIVRNAVLLNYPLAESIRSVLPLCDEFIINCGDSNDSTLSLCQELQREYPDKIRIVESVWTQISQSGGFQLKAQTDAAIAQCKGTWCFYIQADEAIHEEDSDKILAALTLADTREDIDGVLFDYIHFYGNFDYAIRGRNWYRKEVRLFKNGHGIESFRDAQGFRKNGKRLLALKSGARVFHYGYVRSSQSLQTKSNEMARWWGERPEQNEKSFKLVRHIGLYRFNETHPAVMAKRIAQNSLYFNPKECPRKWDKREIKNAITLLWENIFHFRIGEYRNYEVVES